MLKKGRNLECPKCDVFLKRFELEPGLVIDRCHSCDGVWLDEGELAAITTVPDAVFRWAEHLDLAPLTNIQCPACRKEKFQTLLKGVEFTVCEKRVLIDLCPQCTGLWLDANELPAFTEIVRKLRILARKTAGT